MTVELAEKLDLGLAWKRARADLPHSVFVRHPFEIELIESDLAGWLSGLTTAIADGQYRPSPMVVCDVPKGKGAIRPGAHLGVKDRIVFASCVGASLPYIHTSLSWSQGVVDFSYQLAERPEDVKWLRNQFDGWKNFEKNTLDAIEGDVTHVIFTDITGYYENIVLETLMSDLRQTGAPESVIVQLSSLLNKWAEAPGRGLPQGHAPSDILGKVYLNSIDESLRNFGIIHFRYVDDYRILCRSEVEAKSILMELTKLLRKRGLSLQTAKTDILSVEQSRHRVESLTKVLLQVCEQLLEDVKEFCDATGYLPFDEAEKLIEESVASASLDPNDTALPVIQEAFDQNFIKVRDTGFSVERFDPPFDKTLFHFLLNRLSKARDDFAVDYCLSLLPDHPEETGPILRYLERIDRIAACDDLLAEFLTSPDAIYAFQKYQIAECWLKETAVCSEQVLRVFRTLAFDQREPAYLRSTCRAVLGKFGTPADLEQLQYAYAEARGPFEQCEILCCLGRMESKRRNAFLARQKEDSDLHGRAVAYARG